MNWPNDIHNQRARVGTAIFMVLLLLFIFFFGLTYLNPPPNNGPVINFGFDEQGAGETASSEQVDEPVEEAQQTPPTPAETTPVITDDVTTQDVEEAAVVDKKENPKPPTETPKKEEKPKEDPKPDTQKLDDLFSKTKNQQDASKNDGNKSGEGVTKGGGDQGKETGDRNSKSRDGQGGPGDGNYRLGGRSALNKVKPPYDCPEEGRVVVKVYVDRSGKVIRAIPGEAISNGPVSTTSASCLFKEAKNAALKTTWQPDPSAKEQQIGYIVYNFFKN